MHEKPSQGADRFRELQRVLDAALDAPHDARPGVLDDMCRGDAELRRDVARMLAACETDDGFLDAPVALFAEPLLADILPRRAAPGLGTEIGDYRIVGNLGHGGMGTVFAAERRDGTGDRVALKLVTPGMESERAIRRFAQERRILGSLDHPAIARLLDAGVTPEGVPFLVMELIDGRPIDRYCDDRCLPIDARLALFCRVCDAVRYAHENHVIHRDLKPRNLLVTADGDLKLLDFGIAKLLAEAPVEDLLVTTATFRPMTPEFASPEQLRAETLTPASDIYSLGILLTILLSGHHPHRILGLHRAELTRIVLRQDPEPPSKALMRVGDSALESREELTPAGIAAARSTTVDELASALTGPLDTIALTALATDPARRFSSADALATAIRRHLDGRPIAPSTLRARLASLFRRDGRSRRGES